MVTKEEILAKYQDLHDRLGRQKDAPDKEKFDNTHRQLWKKLLSELEKAGFSRN